MSTDEAITEALIALQQTMARELAAWCIIRRLGRGARDFRRYHARDYWRARQAHRRLRVRFARNGPVLPPSISRSHIR